MAYSRIKHITVPGLRLHLRRGEPDMLWVNGENLLILNETASDFIEAFIEVMANYPEELDNRRFKEELIARMQQKYPRAPAAVLLNDFDNIYGSLLEIGSGSCPVSDVKLDTRAVNPQKWTAPPRMDLALTYRCNNNCYFCYTGGPQKVTELDTTSWKQILDKLWDNGVPQVVFTGGEPTLREDLVELVDHAKEFVTGLITNGRKLPDLAADLKKVDLDYIQVSLEANTPQIHDHMVRIEGAWQETVAGITAALNSGLEVITNTTLTKDNIDTFSETIAFGASLGLKTMASNTLLCSGRGTCSRQNEGVPFDQLKIAIKKAQETAHKAGIRLEWYSPTCYKQFNPIEFGLGPKSCSAAQYNMTIEPDGAVIPCQSWLKEKTGNILRESWEQIWNNPINVDLRNKKYLKDREECRECEYLAECCGGCPLEYAH
jgi:radical SAM protein with 4Fe4S-binding SPASM domain